MVVLIVLIVMIASIIKAKMGVSLRHSHRFRHGRHESESLVETGAMQAENGRLREEMARLKDRVAVLERIATDKNHLLEEEFERLRNR
jgi:hypothetical protein